MGLAYARLLALATAAQLGLAAGNLQAQAEASSEPKTDEATDEPDAQAAQKAAQEAAQEGALDPEATKKKIARDLAWEGVDLFEAGQFKKAAQRFEKAYVLQPVPTVGLWSARALRESGSLVEASERYVEVIRSPAEANEPPVYAQARRDASSEYEALQKRVPRLGFEIQGPEPNQVNVQVDGKVLPTELLTLALPTNPGRHRVVARFENQEKSFELELNEGQQRTLEIAFDVGGNEPVTAEPTPTIRTPPTAAAPGPAQGMPTAAWVGFGVGAAGVAVGAGLAFSAQSKETDLEGMCPKNRCSSPEALELHDAFNRERIGSLVAYGVGAAGIVTALVVLLSADRGEEPNWAISPGGVSWRGRF